MIKRIVSIFVLNILLISVATAVTSDEELAKWNISYEHDLVLIDTGNILTPIEINKPQLVVTHTELGRFIFSEGEMISVSRIPITELDYIHDSSHRRPTLFISVPGYRGLDNGLDAHQLTEGDGISKWQTDLEAQLSSKVPDSYQYRHWMIDWHSAKSNRGQVRDLAKEVSAFLNRRKYSWDVVIVGHSRGGVFTHELSKRLVTHDKIDALHTILLDPTASTKDADIYPHSMYTSSGTRAFGSVYFDEDGFIEGSILGEDLDLSIFTMDNMKITGYNNYGRKDFYMDSLHADFPKDFIEKGKLDRLLSDVLNKKEIYQVGHFAQDVPANGAEVVAVSISGDIYLDGEFDLSDDQLYAWAELGIGPVTNSAMIYMGENGVEAAAVILVASASASINRDHAKVMASDGLNDLALSLESMNLQGDVRILSVTEGAFSIGDDGIVVSASVLNSLDSGISITSDGVDADILGIGGAVHVSCSKCGKLNPTKW